VSCPASAKFFTKLPPTKVGKANIDEVFERFMGVHDLNFNLHICDASGFGEYERAHPTVLPKENVLQVNRPGRYRVRHASSQPPPQKMPRLQNASRGIYEAATLSS